MGCGSEFSFQRICNVILICYMCVLNSAETWAEFHISVQFLNILLYFVLVLYVDCSESGPGLWAQREKIPFSSSALSIISTTTTI